MLCTFNRTLTVSHPEGLYTLGRTDQLSVAGVSETLADKLAESALTMLADKLALAIDRY